MLNNGNNPAACQVDPEVYSDLLQQDRITHPHFCQMVQGAGADTPPPTTTAL